MIVIIGLVLFVGLQLVGILVAQARDPKWQARQDPSITAGRKALSSDHI